MTTTKQILIEARRWVAGACDVIMANPNTCYICDYSDVINTVAKAYADQANAAMDAHIKAKGVTTPDEILAAFDKAIEGCG